MATYNNGISGSFSGTVGPVVGAYWKGIPYMRSKGRRSHTPPTIKQLSHQAKFSLVTKFVHSIGKLLMCCYPQTPELTGINHAFSDIYANALTGAYPSIGLDYSKVLISKGELHNTGSPSVTAITNGIIEFSWVDNTDHVMANADDRAVMLLYCPDLKQSIYNLSGPERNQQRGQLNASLFSGYAVESWLTFISKNGEEVSTSVYTGRVVVE